MWDIKLVYFSFSSKRNIKQDTNIVIIITVSGSMWPVKLRVLPAYIDCKVLWSGSQYLYVGENLTIWEGVWTNQESQLLGSVVVYDVKIFPGSLR